MRISNQDKTIVLYKIALATADGFYMALYLATVKIFVRLYSFVNTMSIASWRSEWFKIILQVELWIFLHCRTSHLVLQKAKGFIFKYSKQSTVVNSDR